MSDLELFGVDGANPALVSKVLSLAFRDPVPSHNIRNDGPGNIIVSFASAAVCTEAVAAMRTFGQLPFAR